MENKQCAQCGATFGKPPTCSRRAWTETRKFCSPACKKLSQIGGVAWNAGLKFPDRPKQFVPCRVCGQPTKYRGSDNAKLVGMVHCGKPDCMEQSRNLKNQNISQRAKRAYADGTRTRINGWQNAPLVSKEEVALTPWFESLGWIAQLKINTRVHTNKLPRYLKPDFAEPSKRLYVEIDGDSHRLRKERDARRDALLTNIGWTGLRISADAVRNNPEGVKQTVLSWIARH